MTKNMVIFSGMFLMKGDKILLLKRKSEGDFNGFWGVPGGHLGFGEFFSDSAIRETTEEIGIVVNKKNIINQTIVISKDHRLKEPFIGYYGLCTTRKGTPINNEPNKCSKIARYTISNLPDKITPCAKNALKSLLDDKNYIELS